MTLLDRNFRLGLSNQIKSNHTILSAKQVFQRLHGNCIWDMIREEQDTFLLDFKNSQARQGRAFRHLWQMKKLGKFVYFLGVFNLSL